MLFGKKKKKKTAPPAPKPKKIEKLMSLTYTQSDSFRGFRKVRLSGYYRDEIQTSLNALKEQGYDLKGCKVRLDRIRSNEQYNEYEVIKVYVSGKLIGSVFNSDEQAFSMLTDYEIDKVHVRIEDSCPDEIFENVVTARAYLFVHYPADAPIKITVE